LRHHSRQRRLRSEISADHPEHPELPAVPEGRSAKDNKRGRNEKY
jgi:hypothetical protein